MEIQDDRTPEQKKTHKRLVVGTDRFLSGWGLAKDGVSYAAWACEDLESFQKCWKRIKGRTDMKNVREAFDSDFSPYKPRGNGHYHIYVWEKERKEFV